MCVCVRLSVRCVCVCEVCVRFVKPRITPTEASGPGARANRFPLMSRGFCSCIVRAAFYGATRLRGYAFSHYPGLLWPWLSRRTSDSRAQGVLQSAAPPVRRIAFCPSSPGGSLPEAAEPGSAAEAARLGAERAAEVIGAEAPAVRALDEVAHRRVSDVLASGALPRRESRGGSSGPPAPAPGGGSPVRRRRPLLRPGDADGGGRRRRGPADEAGGGRALRAGPPDALGGPRRAAPGPPCAQCLLWLGRVDEKRARRIVRLHRFP